MLTKGERYEWFIPAGDETAKNVRMTSKEIVQRTIAYHDPPRIPFAFWSLYIGKNPDLSSTPILQRFEKEGSEKVVCALDDIKLFDYKRADGSAQLQDLDDGTAIDEWGVKWRNHVIVGHPLDSWSNWPKYDFPDASAIRRFDGIPEAIEANNEKYLLGLVWNSTFERMWMLRGFENLLCDYQENRKLFCELRDRYLEFNLTILERWLQTSVDAIYFGDDFGTQHGPIMSPKIWCEIYLPMYRVLFDRTRAAEKSVFFHSCGNIYDIVGHLLDCGMNVLNPVQPNAIDVRFLLKKYGKDLVVWGATDMQQRITFGTPSEIETEVEQVAQLCWRGGGYIGGTAQGNPPGAPIANLEAFMRAFLAAAGFEI